MINDAILIDYLKKAKTAWHGVQELENLFIQAGFTELKEQNKWNLTQGNSYYIKRNGRSLAAFSVGTASLPTYRIIVAHTDSPHLRLKTQSLTWLEKNNNGLQTAHTSVYGGAILNTWLDRPLALAGSVYVRTKQNSVQQYLFDSIKPIGIIPNLPIHLNREVNKGQEIKPQEQLSFIFDIPTDLTTYIANELGILKEDILSHELELYLPQGPIVTEGKSPLLIAPRIDNQIHCILGAQALIEQAKKTTSETTPIGFFFDSEETGSLTRAGAHSSFADNILERISLSLEQNREDQLRSKTNSFILSADVAHAWNPNFAEKYDPAYKCILNQGCVIKVDTNNKYATNSETEAKIKLMAKKESVTLQKFIIHSDLPCGSTVGPIISSNTSIPCIDIGIAIWAMHSICETAGMKDIKDTEILFKTFFSYT